jgi:hypothetical protein
MRRHEQLSLAQPWIVHPHARELEGSAGFWMRKVAWRSAWGKTWYAG